jgi:ATP-dependent helicase/DNAse subunit B
MPQRRVFVCDSFAVLQDALVTAVTSVQDADPLAPATVIASSAPLALRLRRAIARVGSGRFGLRVCTLTDFARDIAEDLLLQAARRPLPSLAAPLLIKRFLAEDETDNYFAPLALLPGFPHSVLATLTDLRQAGVSPQLFQTFLDRAPQGEISRQKLASLCSLYEWYLRFLTERGLYDDNTIVERAIEALQSEALLSPLFVYGFHDFTPLQRRLIAAAVADRDALVFFPWRPGNAYECATPTLTWFTNIGFQTVPLEGGHKNEGNLARLQTGLFEERPPARTAMLNKGDQSVLFLSAPGKNQEAREIGRVIFHLVQTQGVRFHEIGIFLREPGTYGPLFVDTFQGLGIPTFLHGGLSLIRTQAGQRFLLLCQVLLEDYTRSRIIEFIRGAELPLSALLGEQAAAARFTQWELFSVQAGIVKGAQAWRDRLARLMRDQPDDEGDETKLIERQALQALISFMDGFLAASEQRPQSNSWRGWTDFVLRLMSVYVSPTEHTGEVEEVLLGLTELDLLDGAISFAEWTRNATSALTSATVSVGALDKKGVFIGDLLAARGLQFRAVIIPGLVEGSFPRMVRQDPLLLDQERQYLSEFSSHELRQRRHLSETEQFLFVLAVQSAREWVVFSYPYAEHGGDLPRTPSFFLLRAIEALSGTPTSFEDLREWERRASLLPAVLGPPSEAVDLIEYHLLSAAHAVASGDSTSLGYLPICSPFFSAAFHATRQRWDVERLTAFDGMIEDEVVKEKLQQTLFPAGLRLSASALETYARCPFRYFLSTVLGLNQFEEPEQILTLRPRERGALLHEILHDFFTRAREVGKLSFTSENKPALQRLLRTVTEEHFHKFATSGATGFPLLWEIEQERLRERLSAFLERECETGGEFLPTAFEVHFGASAPEGKDENSLLLFPDGPVRLHLFDGEEVALRGRIDRIDLSPDQRRARIVDYKTGKPIRGRFAGGTALQLPLYLYAAHALWPEKTWESAAYLYVDRERKVDSPVFTAANWESSFATLNEVVTKLLHSLRIGCFTMTPEACFPCPFPLICGGVAARRAARKQHDPRLEALHWVRAVE